MPSESGALRALDTSPRPNFEHLATATYTPAAKNRAQRLSEILGAIPAPDCPDEWRATSAVGRIVVTPDERPIRTIITGRKRIVTGSYASRKARRALPHESMVELAFFHFSEVDTAVVDYRAQPFRFEFTMDGALRSYIADCARLLADGSVEVVELKSDIRALRDADYSKKLNAVRQMCERLGWRFRIVFGSQLAEPAIRRRNVRLVQSQRTARYDTAHCHLALDLLERRSGEVSLAELTCALGERRLGEAIAMAMMVGRLVDIDLNAPICGSSLVRALPDTFEQTLEGARL